MPMEYTSPYILEGRRRGEKEEEGEKGEEGNGGRGGKGM